MDTSLPDDAARIETAFRICLGRKPTSEEAAIVAELLKEQREHFIKAPEAAKQFVDGHEDAAPERAAWTAVARVMLNLDETITKE